MKKTELDEEAIKLVTGTIKPTFQGIGAAVHYPVTPLTSSCTVQSYDLIEAPTITTTCVMAAVAGARQEDGMWVRLAMKKHRRLLTQLSEGKQVLYSVCLLGSDRMVRALAGLARTAVEGERDEHCELSEW